MGWGTPGAGPAEACAPPPSDGVEEGTLVGAPPDGGATPVGAPPDGGATPVGAPPEGGATSVGDGPEGGPPMGGSESKRVPHFVQNAAAARFA